MWERDEDRLALLELLLTGALPRRSTQADSWAVLHDQRWTRRSRRRDEVELVPRFRQSLIDLLDHVWADWRVGAEALALRELDPTPAGWRLLHDLLRAESLPRLPVRLNRRTAASAVAPHSKSDLSSIRRRALADTEVTHDGIVRLRPPTGIHLSRGEIRLEAAPVAHVLGEVAITERALRDGTTLKGDIVAVLLVENLGAYQDLNPPAGWLIAHVPGWETSTIRLFLNQLQGVTIVHFGDLDPIGVRIFRHLKEIRSDLRWAVPAFWGEYVDSRGLACDWPDDLELSDAPELVREVAQRGLWLEQELIALDPRLRWSLEALLLET